MKFKYVISVMRYSECLFTHTGYYSSSGYAYRAAMHYAKRYPDSTLVRIMMA
nr:MAG TPA: hypothetical protein [Bacteriophage sp.]